MAKQRPPSNSKKSGMDNRSQLCSGSDCFEYTPLNNRPRSFRYLKLFPPGDQGRIECRIYHSTVNERKGLYKALSYTWGSPHVTRTILLNGRHLSVRKNLFDFLEMYSKERATSEGVDLWIDAVCINQDDTSERNNQVRIMGDIYSQAEEVVAWLGPSTLESDFLFDFLNDGRITSLDHGLNTRSGEHGDRHVLARLSAAFAHLDARDYWRRIWVVQEIYLASRVAFWVGCRHINGLLLRLSLNQIDKMDIELMPSAMKPVVTAVGTNEYTNLEDCIRKFGSLKCQDALDKVYALLGMVKAEAHNTAALDVKYENSAEELFARTLTYCRPRYPMDFALYLGHLLSVTPTTRIGPRWWSNLRGAHQRLTHGHPLTVCFHPYGSLAEVDFVSDRRPYPHVQCVIASSALNGQDRKLPSPLDHNLALPISVFKHEHGSAGDLIFSIDPPRFLLGIRDPIHQPCWHGISVSTSVLGSLKPSSLHLGCIIDLSVREWAAIYSAVQACAEQLALLEAFVKRSVFSIKIDAGQRVLEVTTDTSALMNYASAYRSGLGLSPLA